MPAFGKDAFSTALAPANRTRRAERAKRAMETIDTAIPEMLRASPRARHGIHKADLLVDPPAVSAAPTSNNTFSYALPQTHIKIRLRCEDTLSAAKRLSERPFASKRTQPTAKSQNGPNVTVLNMASPLRPGGGFVDGANSQEEFICARTTLFPSLWDSFYRLPELGGIYTPDVLVFRDSTPEANEILKRDRYFVDVISAGMFRFPESPRGRAHDGLAGGNESGCSCGVSYCDRDRDLVTRKMKAVVRMAEAKGAEKLVLGAWGCGAYGNPVREVAKIWRKVIAGSPRQRRPNSEQWTGIKEIVFAIPDRSMLKEFEQAFADVLNNDPITPPSEVDASNGPTVDLSSQDAMTSELISRIQVVELQLEETVSTRTKARLRQELAQLNKELGRGLANKAAQEEDLTLQEDEEVDEFVVSGFPASDGEDEDDADNSVYNFDENDVASDESISSEGERSEIYEFRPAGQSSGTQRPTSSSVRGVRTPHDTSTEDDGDGSVYNVFPPSPNFNPQTGWFTGSMDQLTRLLRLNGAGRRDDSKDTTPGSPLLRPDSGGQEIDEMTINAYLNKYGGTDDVGRAVAMK